MTTITGTVVSTGHADLWRGRTKPAARITVATDTRGEVTVYATTSSVDRVLDETPSVGSTVRVTWAERAGADGEGRDAFRTTLAKVTVTGANADGHRCGFDHWLDDHLTDRLEYQGEAGVGATFTGAVRTRHWGGRRDARIADEMPTALRRLGRGDLAEAVEMATTLVADGADPGDAWQAAVTLTGCDDDWDRPAADTDDTTDDTTTPVEGTDAPDTDAEEAPMTKTTTPATTIEPAAVTDRAAAYLDRLVHPPKRDYAAALVDWHRGAADTAPEAPDAPWAAKVAAKVARLQPRAVELAAAA